MSDYPRIGNCSVCIIRVFVAGDRWVYHHLNEPLEGPLSLADYVHMIKITNRRKFVKPLCESLLAGAATAWTEIQALQQRVAELEKALLSPENAEPVIAKLLGLKEEG